MAYIWLQNWHHCKIIHR